MSLSNPSDHWDVPLPARYSSLDWRQKQGVRREYARLQKHKCWCCGESLYEDPPIELQTLPIDWDLFPPDFLKYPVHLQHNHQTDLTEGVVHSFCNAFLWHYFRR